MRVGIPRALVYHYGAAEWEAFLTELGCEVVVSDSTTRDTLERGLRHALRDLCLPVKAFFGHLDLLASRVDRILVPRLVSRDASLYFCPKLLALVDLAAVVVPRHRIVTVEINAKKGPEFTRRSWQRLARELGADASSAERALARLDETARSSRHSMDARYEAFRNRQDRLGIAILGHPYVVRDPHISSRILDWFLDEGAEVITYEAVPEAVLEEVDPGLFRDVYWESARDLFRASVHFMTRDVADGAVFVSAFGCGPDSFIADILSRRARGGAGFPFVHIVVDEHTARTGVETRLEAFWDMVEMKRGKRA